MLYRSLRLLLLLSLVGLPTYAGPPVGEDDEQEDNAAGGDEPGGGDAAGVGDAGATLYPLSALLDPLQADRLFRETTIGLQVVNTRTGEEVYAYHADEALIPASVMKVVTAAVALRTLGPAWQFTTALLVNEDTELDAEGVLKGSLYVWGGGDPTLVVEDMWRMARDLRIAGINTIEGDLIFDGEYFDQDYLIAGWGKGADITNGPAYFAPIAALTVNYNTTCIVVAPGQEAGQPARVLLETPTELVELESEVVTGRPGSRPWMTIERDVDWAKGSVKVKLAGSIPITEVEPWRYYRTMPNPSLHFADTFRKMLEQQGIRVKGRNRLGKAPDRDVRVVVSHKSEPLQHLLAEMNKSSSNIIAESVLKAIGAEVRGVPGTTAKGVEVIQEYLTGLGIPASDYTILNGSGLSREQLVPPSLITAVLLDMKDDRRVGPEFLASLSVAGQDGTLRSRFPDEKYAGRVRGKTGSVNGVYCLAGFIQGGDGETYAFAFFVNDLERSSRTVRKLQDRFGVALLDLSPPVGAQ